MPRLLAFRTRLEGLLPPDSPVRAAATSRQFHLRQQGRIVDRSRPRAANEKGKIVRIDIAHEEQTKDQRLPGYHEWLRDHWTAEGHMAASQVQRMYRGWHARLVLLVQQTSAAQLQRAVRGRLAAAARASPRTRSGSQHVSSRRSSRRASKDREAERTHEATVRARDVAARVVATVIRDERLARGTGEGLMGDHAANGGGGASCFCVVVDG